MLLAFAFSCAAAEVTGDYYPSRAGVDVTAIFAVPEIQPYVGTGKKSRMIDTVWVYYTDGTFDQYADPDGKIVLFSRGAYKLGEAGTFLYERSNAAFRTITVRRSERYQKNGLAPFESTVVVEFGTLGLVRIAAIER